MARLLWFCLALAAAAAQDYPSSTPPSTPETPSGDEEVGPDGKTRKEVAGQYIYCAEDNCYELLGVKPTSSPIVIKRSYRRLATEWHPDKNPHPKAKEIFQKYANAYEVLSNSEMRKNYDYLLAHPYEFPMHYLRFSSGKYAPKSDVRFVVFLVVLAVSVVQYLIQGQRRANVIQTLKSKRQFQERLKVLTAEIASANSSTKTVAKPRSGSGKEATSSKAKTNSKKKSENDEAAKEAEAKLLAELDPDLPPVPDLKHTLAFQLFTLPLTGSYWFKDTSDWVLKFRIMGKEYGPEERALLTRLALNLKPHEWERLSEEEKEEYLGLELWVKANKAAYDEEIASSQDSESTRRSAKERRAIRQKKKPTDSVPMMD